MDPTSQPTSAPFDMAPSIALTDIYNQALTTMRATDEISVKLLAAVPFVSGVGITLLARRPTEDFPATLRLFVSLFAAIVTLAIYRWERRNMSHCRRLRSWAAGIERESFNGLPAEARAAIGTSPHGDNLSGRFFSRTWGKTQAELLLYSTVIGGWLTTGLYTAVS